MSFEPEILPPACPMDAVGEEMMTETELAQFLRYSPEKVRKMRFSGRGPVFVQIGYPPSTRYLRKDVMDWLDRNRLRIMPIQSE